MYENSANALCCWYFHFFWPYCMACGILGDPLTRDWTWATAVKVSSPNHWTGREFPCLLHFSHSDGRTVVLHYGHNLHFPYHYWSWAFFHIFHIFSYIAWKSGYPFFFFAKTLYKYFANLSTGMSAFFFPFYYFIFWSQSIWNLFFYMVWVNGQVSFCSTRISNWQSTILFSTAIPCFSSFRYYMYGGLFLDSLLLVYEIYLWTSIILL